MRNPETIIIAVGLGACALLAGLAQARTPIPFIIGFGVVGTLIFIAGFIFNAAVGRGSSPAPWMRRFRRYQNQMENAGWRIQIIPYDDSSKPMTISLKGWPLVLQMVGFYGFLAALPLACYVRKHGGELGAIIAVASLSVGALGCRFKNRDGSLEWDVAPARCVDRELGKVPVRGGWAWVWRIVCQYEFLGIPHRVTPEVYWASFPSEAAAQKFLEARISREGECMLRVDPRNPLRTELLERGIED